MANKYHWHVKLPEDDNAPLTREQGWAVLSRLETQISIAMHRLKANAYGLTEGDQVLPEDEADELRAVYSRLKKLTGMMELDVLDKLAKIKEDEERRAESEEEDFRWLNDHAQILPRKIKVLMTDYHGDIARFERDGGDPVVLALGILQKDALEPGEIGKLIETHFDPKSKWTDVHDCPQCDDYNPGKVGDDYCRRCYGWGYVFGDKPDNSEYDWSETGRHALNNGEEWTVEMEKSEQERLRLEDAV